MNTIQINSEPIELYKILKFEGLVASGGEAKSVIEQGEVMVNGKVETRKRRKMYHGDRFNFAHQQYILELDV